MSDNQDDVGKVLRFSAISLFIFSFGAIIFGLLLASKVILFDGIYALLGVLTSYATLKISQFIRKVDHFNFPFGKEALEPAVVMIQYLILGVLLILTFLDALYVIYKGGNVVELRSVVIYLIIAAVFVYVVTRRLSVIGKDSNSPLVEMELAQWKISLKQTIWTLVGYFISYIMVRLSFEQILPYIDPAILILFVIITFFTVAKELATAFKELIGMRTITNALHKEINDKIYEITKIYNIKDYYLRLRKVGSMIVVEVDFLVDKSFRFGDVDDQDKIREKIEQTLSNIEYELWLSIAFTTRYKWMR